jgi:5-methylcytosine-specific restriction endonuclease McrA
VPPANTRGTHRADYCSNACKGARVREVHQGKVVTEQQRARQSAAMKGRPSKRKLPPRLFDCVGCGKGFAVSRKVGTRGTAARRFCSPACWYGYIRERPERGYHYRGGPFFSWLYGPNWPSQARLARERDNHTCRDCGKHQERPRLNVHHIVARRTFGDDYVTGNDLGNLVSLCASCHTKREVATARR